MKEFVVPDSLLVAAQTSADSAEDRVSPVGQQSTETIERGPFTVGAKRYALLVFHREGARVVFLEQGRPLVIGRGSTADVDVSDAGISRRHARFTLNGSEVLFEDLASRNGVWLAGERVENGVLRVGGRVSMGGVVVTLQLVPDAGLSLLGIESHETFVLALEEELVRCRQSQRPFALWMIQADGDRLGRCAAVVRKGVPLARVGLFSRDIVEVLAPESTGADAAAFAQELVQTIGAGADMVVSVASYPEAGQTAEQLVSRCRSELVRRAGGESVRLAHGASWGLEVPADEVEDDELVAESPAMRQIQARIERLAQSSIPVLLLGETGTGKEVVARAIHERSPAGDRPIVYVNCAAIPGQLVESLLFGHERGAFTGAINQQKGVFEAADGGTLFLDEVGELPLAAQAALLRALETRRISRVGSTREFDVNVRLISATNRNLDEMCEKGAFRWDLLYRLNVMPITLPPLRQRLEEIEPLTRRFVARANRANARRIRAVDSAALLALRGYDWPGNVRELRNVIERACVIARGDMIELEDLPERLRSAVPLPPARVPEPRSTLPPASGVINAAEQKRRLAQMEAEMILSAVREAGGNQTEAAKRMGMPLRTLVRKLSAFRLRDKL